MSKLSIQLKNEISGAAQDAVRLIAQAAKDASATIASAAGEARSVLAHNAADAAQVVITKNANGDSDHDILTSFRAETKVQMETISKDIKEIKDGTTKRIDDLEKEKLNMKDSYTELYKKDSDKVHEDLEKRLRNVESVIVRIVTWGSAAMLALGILEFVINHYF